MRSGSTSFEKLRARVGRAPARRSLLPSQTAAPSASSPLLARTTATPLRALVIGSVLTAATVFAMTTSGGKRVRETRPLVPEIDRIADLAGLGVYQLSVAGHRNTTDTDIFEALALQSRSILLFDTLAARESLERLPWVAVAKVRRIFPDELRIDITERQATTRWRNGDDLFLLDADGRVLGRTSQGRNDALPLVAGRGAPAAAASLFEELTRYPDIAERMVSAERIGERRWRLNLTGGRVVELPEAGWIDALSLLAQRHGWGRFLDKSFGVLDLRVPGRVLVREVAVR